MSVASRPESIAGVGEGGVQNGVQHLQDRLLHQAVYSHWDAQLALSSSRLRYLHPAYRLGLVSPVQQRGRQRHMVVPKPVRQFVNGHPIHARLSLISAYPPVRTNEILRVAYLLHQWIRQGSLRAKCRERLLRYGVGAAGSARTSAAGMHSILRLLCVHRSRPPAPCIGRFGPSPGWATIASADFSDPVPPGCPCGSPVYWTKPETSRGKTCLLLPEASDLPAWCSG